MSEENRLFRETWRVKPALIDTDILSLFFRNNPNVVSSFAKYLKRHETINFQHHHVLRNLERFETSGRIKTTEYLP